MRSGSNDGAVIHVEELTVKYPSRSSPSIDNISFSIDKGEFVWLAGDSASGKSTLLNSLCGFIPHIIPAEIKGDIVFDGKKNLGSMQLAKHICMVHQDPESQFCTETVEDEIAFGLENYKTPREEMEKRIGSVLKKLNCSELRYRKLNTLSGGEKQKIAIASMLVLDPDVLILDEPTANLDPVSMEEVLNAVKTIRKRDRDLTLIVAEHRIGDLKGHVDSVLKLRGGALYEHIGDFQELWEDKKAKLVDYSYPDYKRDKKTGKKTVISVKHLSYSVEDNIILNDISFNVYRGEIIALMGRNGSGKTTLVKHIAGLINIQSGKIKVFDNLMTPKKSSSPWEIGKRLAYVFQNPNHQIFENTVEEEMLFGPRNFHRGITQTKKKITALVREENVDKYTHPHTLSFGQRRRLNVHSSSAHDPEIIIVDEPFSGQDHENALSTARILNDQWKNGKTIIVVTHDLGFAKRFCTRALVMKKGSIVYDGDPKRLKNIQGEAVDGR
ncbi:MAG: energy-coupling factor transporter ATPase [Thermoplasmata archaeon]